MILLFNQEIFAEKKSSSNISKKSSNQLQSKDWINPDLEYVKITTDSDAPAVVPFDKIFTFMPIWNGLESKYIHLLHNNQEIYYYLKDQDGILNSSDTLFFLGSRAFGDTTHWDNYATEEPFFLTYFNNSIGKQYKLIENASIVEQTQNNINVDLHIEREKVRSYGKQLYDSDNSDNEGWYWKELFAYETQSTLNTFTTFVNIVPENSELIEIKVFFKSVMDTLLNAVASNKYPEYRLAVFFNNDSLDVREFTRIRKDSFSLSFTPDKIINGVNAISLKSYEVHPYRLGVISIDYITVKYKSKPVTSEFLTSFSVPTISKASNLIIDGFENSEIISIDSINKKIQFPSSNNSKLKIGISLKMEKPLFAVYLNDTAFIDYEKGMHLLKISSKEKRNISSVFQRYYEKPFFDLIEQADTNDIFIIGYNGSQLLQKEFLYALDKRGFAKVKNIKAGESWIFVFSKKQVFFEDVYSSNIASEQLEVDLFPYQYFKSELILEPANKFEIFVRDKSKFAKINILPVAKPYLKNKENAAQGLVIYHSEFKDIAKEYVKFRSNTRKMVLSEINVEDIYNEFNYGKKSPFAIKELIKYAYNEWNDSLQTVVIIGNASWDPYKHFETNIATDFVPTYGFPPSDFWYTTLDNDFIPDISLGRISISNQEDGWNYLEKLKIYETVPDQPWMKNFLFLSGGDGLAQRKSFANLKSYFFDDMIKTEPFCGTSDSVSKYDEAVGGVSESGTIREKINQGAIWVNFLGHAAQNVFDMDGWQAYKLNNYGKYSFFSTISCNTGAFADPGIENVRNEDYVFFKDKGFIGSIGSSTYGWVDENRYIIQRIISQLADSTSKLDYIGDLFNYGKNGLANEGAQLQTKNHSSLIGDPLLTFRISRKPNLYIYPPEFTITNKAGIPEINITDSIAIVHIPIYNNGFKTKAKSIVQIIDSYSFKADTFNIEIPEICSNYSFDLALNIADKPGEHSIKLIIDPKRVIPELKEENRIFQSSFYVFSSSLLMLDPMQMWNIDINEPIFRVINPSHNNGDNYYFSIHSENGELIYQSDESEINIYENFIEWKPEILLPENNYIFECYYIDSLNLRSNTLSISFSARSEKIKDGVSIVQNNEKSFKNSYLENIVYNNDEKSLNISNSNKKMKLVSVGGNEKSIKWGNIEIDNDVYVDSEYFRGFNVVTIPIDAQKSKGQYRRFDTWLDGDNWTGDSTAVELVNYLRDSIPNDSYLLIITSGASWKIPALHQLFNTGSTGTLDTLRKVLREFGSALIDSVQGPMKYDSISWYPWTHSFAMVGRKGWKPGDAVEMMNSRGDSAYIEQDFNFINFKGNLTTIPMGPAKEWKSIEVKNNSNSDSLSNFKISYKLFGKNNLDISELSGGVLQSENTSILIPDTLKKKFKEMYLHFDLEKFNDYSNPEIYSIKYDFIPSPELAILRSQTIIDDTERMRGDRTILHVTFENISLRSDVEGIQLDVKNHSNSGISDIIQKTFPILFKNSSLQESFSIENQNLSIENNFNIFINNNNFEKELYQFNNKHVLPLFTVREDTSKPKLDITFDGKKVENGDFVTRQPLIKINVFDNSPFAFTDSSKIEVFINGAFITPEKVSFYYFYSFNNSSDLKCQLQIIPDSLEYGSGKLNPANNIRIIAKDYYGNADTVYFKLNVARNNSIGEIELFPNPAKESLTFKYEFVSRNFSEYTILKIHNINGQIIRTDKWNTVIGENEHSIELKDDYGNFFPNGIYFYEIQLDSQLWAEPRRGIFYISK